MYIINICSAHEMRFHHQILPTKHVEKFIYTKYSTYGRDLTHGITTKSIASSYEQPRVRFLHIFTARVITGGQT